MVEKSTNLHETFSINLSIKGGEVFHSETPGLETITIKYFANNIKTFFKEYKEMVSLAEKAAKKESVPDMAKVEGLMAKLSVKYATLVVSDDWTEKNTKEYKIRINYG